MTGDRASQGQWIPVDTMVEYRWDLAEINAMQRTPEEAQAIDTRLARQRVRYIVRRLQRGA